MQRVRAVVDPAHGPTVVALTGVAGVGRTRLLAELHTEHLALGTRVIAMRCAPSGFRIAVPPPGGPAPEMILRGVGSAGVDVLAEELAAGPPTLLLIDDAQWLDADTRSALAALLPRIARAPVQLICAVRTPAFELTGLGPAWHTLRTQGNAVAVRLAPWDRDQIAVALRSAVKAQPATNFVARVHRMTRGVPAVVADAIAIYQQAGVIVVVDRHAYVLTGPARRIRAFRLLATIAALGQQALAVAESVSVLAPLGTALPEVLREHHPGIDTDTALDLLVTAGVLHRGGHGRSWRFVIPALTEALGSTVDPYRCCELAAAAVNAVWAGRTELDANAPEVAGWIADAHGLLDPVRSRELLRMRAERALTERRDVAIRYWDALTELAVDQNERGEASALAIMACYAVADYHEVVGRAKQFLDDLVDTVPLELLAQVVGSVVTALQNVGEAAELEKIADRPAGAGPYSICGAQYQAMANAMLGRWRQLRRVLADESAQPAQPAAWEVLAAIADMTRGDLHRLRALTVGAPRWEPGNPEIRWVGEATIALTLALGDYRIAEQMMTRTGFPITGLNSFNRANLAMLGGSGTESIEQARLAVATAVGQGFDLGHTTAVHTLTLLLIAQGRLSGARTTRTGLCDESDARSLSRCVLGVDQRAARRDGDRGGDTERDARTRARAGAGRWHRNRAAGAGRAGRPAG